MHGPGHRQCSDRLHRRHGRLLVFKFRSEGKQVEVVGMNEASAGLVGKLGTHDKAGAGYTIGSH
jgi:hypothetical protein